MEERKYLLNTRAVVNPRVVIENQVNIPRVETDLQVVMSLQTAIMRHLVIVDILLIAHPILIIAHPIHIIIVNFIS